MRTKHFVSVLLMGLASCTTIDAGHVGVPTYFGKVQDSAFDEGLHIINPLTTSVHHIDVRIQKLTVEASATSSDLQTVTSTVSLNYRVNKDEAVDLFQNIGPNYRETVVTPYLHEAIKTVTAQYTAERLISERPEVKVRITNIIESGLKKSHIIVTDLSIEDFRFDKDYQDAITKKQVAEQSAKQAENDLQRIEVEARQKIAKAKGDAEATIAQAKAEAESLRLQREVLTPELLQLRWVEKWNGQLPEVQTGNNSGILVSYGAK